MIRGVAAVIVSIILASSAQQSHAMANPVGPPLPLGPLGLEWKIEQNPEIAQYVARRGYPDWAELVEIDADLPLDTHEVHLYYLRLNREVVFTRAEMLGRRDIGLRLYERPLEPAKRAMIEEWYVTHDPSRSAKRAAMRADAAADRAERAAADAERAADDVEDAAERTERVANRMEQSFYHHLRK